MFISVLGNKYNLGQSVTTINLSLMLSLLTNQKSLLIDTHLGKYSHIEEYLSNSVLNNGLDDFINHKRVNILKDNFHYCINPINDNIDFMTSNKNLKFIEEDALELKETAEKHYKNIVVDISFNYSSIKEYFLEVSDLIILIVDQTRSNIKFISEDIRKYSDKLVVLVNKYNEKISYNVNVINSDLIKENIEPLLIDSLCYSPKVINNTNNNAVMSTVLNKNNRTVTKSL